MTSHDHDPPSGQPPDPLLDDGPLDDDTLAVHAVVDDEATAEQRRRVARDPHLVAQVAAVRAVVAAMAEPIAPPSDDVLAGLRARALDADDRALDEELDVDRVADDVPAPRRPPVVTDLGGARTQRARRLPPLPAVAAVVVLLVLVGVGLLVAGQGGSEDQSTGTVARELAEGNSEDAGGGAEQESGEGRAESGGNDAATADEESGDTAESPAATGPADESLDALLARATASYATEADLLSDIRQVDPEVLAFSAGSGDGDGGEATTTGPAGPSPEALEAQVFASDPIATRCDDVLRAGEPELEPAVAAALVEVDGTPVLVLTTPVPVSDDAPTGFRLTLLDALDCSPRGAVLR